MIFKIYYFYFIMTHSILKNPITHWQFYYSIVDVNDTFKPNNAEYIHAFIDDNGRDYIGYCTKIELNQIINILYKEGWIDEIEYNINNNR